MLLALALLLLLCLPFLVDGVIAFVRTQCEQIAAQRHPAGLESHSIERVAADLRRLRLQLELRENRPGSTGKGLKMAAVRRAYVEVLSAACRQLDVRPPQQSGQLETPMAEIYRVESELRTRGLDVRAGRPDSRAA